MEKRRERENKRKRKERSERKASPFLLPSSHLTSLSFGCTMVSSRNMTRTRFEMLERRSLYSCLKV